MQVSDHYIYRHIRLDTNEVFYVGVGKGRNYYRSKTDRYRNNHWKNIVKKTAYEIEVILYNLTKSDSIEKEKEFIKLYGRVDLKTGSLVNQTQGGDGVIGYIHSDEQKLKISAKMKGIVPYNKGKKLSAEQREKMSISAKERGNPHWIGRKHSEETKLKISKTKLLKRANIS